MAADRRRRPAASAAAAAGETVAVRGRGGPAWAFRLPDERRLVVRALPRRHRHPAMGSCCLGGIALAVASAPIRSYAA